MPIIYLEIGGLIFIYMTLWFILAQLLKDNGIIDIGWGLGFVVVGTYVFIGRGLTDAYILLFLVTLFWGLRLAIYILVRRLHEKKEDWRYQKWRKEWGKHFIIKAFFKVFMTQGVFMFIISLPLIQPRFQVLLHSIQYIGVGISIIGIIWEGIADWQLFKFKKDSNNKGKIIQSGLWKYSRHPNYFGEMLVWWGIFIISISFGNWWISIISPITISGVLIFISTPMLEKQMKKKTGFERYKQSTNRFIPKIF